MAIPAALVSPFEVEYDPRTNLAALGDPDRRRVISSTDKGLRKIWPRYLISVLAVLLGLVLAGLLTILNGVSPLHAYRLMLEGGFACPSLNQCNLIATLQFTTPLIFTGLAAAVAMRSGLLSLGQAGQMVLGAAATAFVADRLHPSSWFTVPAAIAAAASIAAAWSAIAGGLRAYLGVHEVLSTLLMNPIAFILAGIFGFSRVPSGARLGPLTPNAKLSAGFILAIMATVLIWYWFRRTTSGFEVTMVGQAPPFARAAGVPVATSIVRAMALSGLLAGLGGAIETLGVHYRFVSQFSAGGGFDGIAVAALAQLHPLGVLAAAVLLAGVRVGALTGFQIRAGIPRELGNAVIAIILVVVATGTLYRRTRRGSAKPLVSLPTGTEPIVPL